MRRLTFCVTAICVIWACNFTSAQDRGYATSIAWSPDGETIAIGSTTGVWLFDTEFKNERYVDVGLSSNDFSAWPGSLEWNAAGTLLAVGHPVTGNNEGDASIKIIDVDKLEIITRIYWKGWLWTEVAWHPRDNRIAAGGYYGKTVIWDALTGTSVFQFEQSDVRANVSPNSIIAVCWFTESVIAIVTGRETFIVDVELNQTLHSFENPLRDPPDCHRDYKIVTRKGHLVDAKAGTAVDAFEDDAIVAADILIPVEADIWPESQFLEFSPDGSKIIRITEGCLIDVYDGHNSKFLAKIPGGIFLTANTRSSIFRDSLAWNPDGSQFAAVGQFGGVRVWDAETYKLLRRYDGFETSYPASSGLLYSALSEEELNLIDAFKTRCIEALNSEPQER